jgi:transcriptional regulator with XRE-family HTH domain
MATTKERLRALRMNAGYSQKQLSELSAISEESIKSYEIGRRTPVSEALVAFADFFGVSVDWLLCRTDNPEFHAESGKPIPSSDSKQLRQMAALQNVASEYCLSPSAKKELVSFLEYLASRSKAENPISAPPD